MIRSKKDALIEGSIMVLLFGIALAVRLYRLQDFPPGLYVDEAANGVDALAVIDGVRPVFFERNAGREPLLIYLQAIAVLVFGPIPYALRFPPAAVGALSVPAIYWMVREAFRRTSIPARWFGVWTALFVTFSYWHISMSRLGFRAILLPMMASIAFGFFWRAWNRLVGKNEMPWISLIFCGLFTGLTLYTYTAGRLMPIWLALTFVVGSLQIYQQVGWRRLAGAFSIIVGMALVVFVPLGLYFLQHPDLFYGRARDVSVFNTYFVQGSPILALLASILETARMFVDRADPNLRHNPAGRPVFDLLMAVWLLAGLVLAVVRIRILPYFFILSGFLLSAIPAVITAEGVPHSLRAIGMLPTAYMLAVGAMMASGQWLSRYVKWADLWTPLPFFLFSALLGTQTYFGAWQDMDRFRVPFLLDFLKIDMASYGEADGVWLWPFSPNYHWSDATFYPLEFLHQGKADFGFVSLDDETIASTVSDVTQDKRVAYLVRTQDMPDILSASHIMGDPKRLTDFVLGKHARYVGKIDAAENGNSIPLTLYELPKESDYSVYNTFRQQDISFGDQIRLLGFDMGSAVIHMEDEDVSRSTNRVPSGERLWIVLNWEAVAPVGVDLKTSLILKDRAGNLSGQVDDLLIGDRYPVERVWEPGEQTKSYHILPVWAGVQPGEYDLYLRIYEDESLRPYPVVDGQGVPIDSEALLGTVQVEPAVRSHPVEPSNRLDVDFGIGSDVVLTGYSLPKTTIAPGEQLPILLYWRAVDAPSQDYLIDLSLVDTEMQPVADSSEQIGNKDFRSSTWRADDVIRDWKSLSIPTDTPSGAYDLYLNGMVAGREHSQLRLGPVQVHGRPHFFSAPPVSHPMTARYEEAVRLLGVEGPVEFTVSPGERITFDLVWQVENEIPISLVRFVHLLESDGRLVAQQDRVPCDGDCPSPSWMEGEFLIDPAAVEIPSDLTSGDYEVAVGWYEQETFQRLKATSEIGQRRDDGLIVLPIVVHVE